MGWDLIHAPAEWKPVSDKQLQSNVSAPLSKLKSLLEDELKVKASNEKERSYPVLHALSSAALP